MERDSASLLPVKLCQVQNLDPENKEVAWH
jgi:hypothetical protein